MIIIINYQAPDALCTECDALAHGSEELYKIIHLAVGFKNEKEKVQLLTTKANAFIWLFSFTII